MHASKHVQCSTNRDICSVHLSNFSPLLSIQIFFGQIKFLSCFHVHNPLPFKYYVKLIRRSLPLSRHRLYVIQSSFLILVTCDISHAIPAKRLYNEPTQYGIFLHYIGWFTLFIGSFELPLVTHPMDSDYYHTLIQFTHRRRYFIFWCGGIHFEFNVIFLIP